MNEMNDKVNKILMDDNLIPESKVYLIGQELRNEGWLHSDLWYAILEMKDKHLQEILDNAGGSYLGLTIKDR